MIATNESEETGAGGTKSDPRLDDPPKPVVYAGDGSSLTAKIAKLTERLAVSNPTTASPALLTSGSLNEARAYLPHVSPVASEEPITLEMRRIRIADEVNSVAWATERVERSLSALSEPLPEVAPAAGEAAGEVISAEEGSRLQGSHKPRAIGYVVLSCVVVLGAVVLAAGGLRSSAETVLAQPALVPFGLIELTASISNGIELPKEGAVQEPGAVVTGQVEVPIEPPVTPSLGPVAVSTSRSADLHGTSGAARWSPQRGGQTWNISPGTSGSKKKKPELVTHE